MKFHEFDPMEMLHALQKQTLQNAQNIATMTKAFNERSEAINELVRALNHQHLQVQDLHARIQLLEMARQNEKN
jgi:metal-responsive CopG/Arc/MetJ family transcriptional regulator